MNCPDIEQLLGSPRRVGMDEHAASCDACGGVLGLSELRDQIGARTPEACVDAEILISKREVSALASDDKQRLQNHLEECADCNELAVRMGSLPSPVREVTSVAAQTGEFRLATAEQGRRTPPLYWWFAAALFALFTGVFGLAMGFALSSQESAVAAAPPQGGTAAPSPGGAAPQAPPVVTPFGVLPLPGGAAQPSPSAGASTDDDSDPVSPALNPFGLATPPSTSKQANGFLTIMCAPVCDKIVVAGRDLGPSPQVRRPLPTGRHKVVLKRGSFTKSINVTIVENTTTARRVDMTGPGAEDAADGKAFGYLNVNCNPACTKVYVDGKSLGPSPIVRRKLSAGKHVIALWRLTELANKRVTIHKGQTRTVIHRWTSKPSCSPPYLVDQNGLKRIKPECMSGKSGVGDRALITAHKNRLKARVAAGKASKQDKAMLRALCRQLADASCTN